MSTGCELILLGINILEVCVLIYLITQQRELARKALEWMDVYEDYLLKAKPDERQKAYLIFGAAKILGGLIGNGDRKRYETKKHNEYLERKQNR